MSIRQTVTFTEPQMKWLKGYSRALGITVSDAIRRVLDEHRGRPDAYPPGDKITVTGGGKGATATVRRG